MTVAHFQSLTLNARIREWVPEHDPRTSDPHHKLFVAAKKQMRAQKIPCWRCGVTYALLLPKGFSPTKENPLASYQLEAHHSDLEFSLINAVDVEKWWSSSTRDDPGFMVESFSQIDKWLHRHPEMAKKDHEDLFQAYMESEGNLMQLCDVCHRSKDQGIHHIPYPDWRVGIGNVWREDLPSHIQVTNS